MWKEFDKMMTQTLKKGVLTKLQTYVLRGEGGAPNNEVPATVPNLHIFS
jgi:hypothetical protein